jgi:hypothetical protein
MRRKIPNPETPITKGAKTLAEFHGFVVPPVVMPYSNSVVAAMNTVIPK